MTNMTNEKAIDILQNDIEICTPDQEDAVIAAIRALENMSHLTDRPCEVCEFHTDVGCSQWSCVFEEVNADEDGD